MDGPARLALRFPLAIDHARQSLVLSTFSERIRFTGIPPDVGVRVLQQLNSGLSANDVAERNPDDRSLAHAFIDRLKHEQLAVDSASIFYSGQDLVALLKYLYERWNQMLFSHSLWISLANGTARQSVLDGWLIESYHFIRGANARLNYAASLAQDGRLKQIFAHHYVEEYDHHTFFAESLRRRGIDVARVERKGPLPSTTAVLNMARRAARIDSLAYAACSGLLESTGSDAGRARGFYADVATHYDRDATLFMEPLLKHVNLDEEYEHGSVMADVFGPIPYIARERADQVIATVALFRETLTLWFADIERFYFLHPSAVSDSATPYRANPPS
ncbi:MAG: hypothetical protein JWQ94_1431 [Tardiphaga sp.]|jgi:hypothetical protein|nr:hypothetical protein [Tardiphaga sp.]